MSWLKVFSHMYPRLNPPFSRETLEIVLSSTQEQMDLPLSGACRIVPGFFSRIYSM